MAQQQPQRKKHVPQRMCIACRQGAGKRQLVRVVRTANGVEVDPGGKLAGRGAYLHPWRRCWQQALDGRLLQRALRTQIQAEALSVLRAYAENLPEDEEEENSPSAGETA